MRTALVIGLGVVIVAAACAPAPTRSGDRPAGPAGPGQEAQSARTGGTKTLTMAVRSEATTLYQKAAAGVPSRSTWSLFNAGLTYVDGGGATHPYLLESLPRVNTDSWSVHPDGRMEVIYKLRQGLTWHDGAPLDANDYVFTHRALTASGLGMFVSNPQNVMESAEALDARTFVIRYVRPFPDAANFRDGEFEPLPRHIMEESFTQFLQDPAAGQEAFRNHPYWAHEYVAAGPFKVERWEPGAHLEGSAFQGYALGRPKIDRLIIRFMTDENTVLSNLLGENLDFATDFTLRWEHAKVLKTEWGASKRGVILVDPSSTALCFMQFRPDLQKTPALLDVRVRRAMAHSIDRQSLNDGLFDGEGMPTETPISKDYRYFAEVDRAIARYPYDPRRTEQLMNEAGFTKDRDGFVASAAGERFRPSLWSLSGPHFERQGTLMTETFARSGIEVQHYVLPAAQGRDVQTQATFPGYYCPGIGTGERGLAFYYGGNVGSAANRWIGSNRGGYVDPEYDRLYGSFETNLDRGERDKLVVAMMKHITEQVAHPLLYFNLLGFGHLSRVKGPAIGHPDRTHLWNVHEWTVE